MRRILSLLLVLLALMSLLSVVAFAVTEHTDTLPYETSFAVLARAVYTSSLPEFPIDNGKGGGTLPDGTGIWAENAPAGAELLVVRKIAQSETEPYAWFKQLLNGKGELFQAYEIYFLDAGRNRIPANGALITLSVPGDMKKAVLYSVTTGGTYAKLTDTLTGTTASFITDGSHYYVFAGYKPLGSLIFGNGFIKTGDEANAGLLLCVCAMSLVTAAVILWLMHGRKDKDKDKDKEKE